MSSVGKRASGNSRSKSISPGRTRTLRTSLRFRSDTPRRILLEARKRYKTYLLDDDALEDWNGSDLRKSVEQGMTPGDWLRHLREAHGLTQEELGGRLGRVGGNRVSDWEGNRRSVSKTMAKRLSGIFRVSPDRFI
jgi:DNA-binding transcriptional regulator YiaG